MLQGLDYIRAADAAMRVFAARATHSFSPEFVMPAEWRPEVEALAAQLGFADTRAAAKRHRPADPTSASAKRVGMPWKSAPRTLESKVLCESSPLW